MTAAHRCGVVALLGELFSGKTPGEIEALIEDQAVY